MRAFSNTAGVRIVNESFVEDFVEILVKKMVDYTISNRCFMDMSALRIIDPKFLIASMFLCFVF